MMKKILVTLALVGVLGFTSCKQKDAGKDTANAPEEVVIEAVEETTTNEYRTIDQEKVIALNKLVLENALITEEAILEAYAPKDDAAEGKYTYEITDLKKDNTGLSTITLVEDYLMDDSIKAKKVIIDFKTVNDKLEVVSIKESYQCYAGRGHEEWSAEFCS